MIRIYFFVLFCSGCDTGFSGRSGGDCGAGGGSGGVLRLVQGEGRPGADGGGARGTG